MAAQAHKTFPMRCATYSEPGFPYPTHLATPPRANTWRSSAPPTPSPHLANPMSGIQRSVPVPAYSSRPLRGWMLGTASHTPGKPHSPHTIESLVLPLYVLKFIERGFGMRVVRKDGQGAWDLTHEECLCLVQRTRRQKPQDEERIQAAERGLQAVRLVTPPPTTPPALPSPTSGSPPASALRTTRLRSISKGKPYDRCIEV
ncbi:hypothetical protein CspeluHIS016_0210380 [Cutaneotrichosporon spelunceum]|uniref:Uncharacterized protein n=1 Tax=Cutaneotrichosporon spelunceum TaxID=1672016 RepID=A0AAD3TSF0_9TREE|nr:hypothetical protein CspeluHIS016_0210380 [Cutaneotrichosporon spelunceum]